MYVFENPVLQRELLVNLRTNRAFLLLAVYQVLLGGGRPGRLANRPASGSDQQSAFGPKPGQSLLSRAVRDRVPDGTKLCGGCHHRRKGAPHLRNVVGQSASSRCDRARQDGCLADASRHADRCLAADHRALLAVGGHQSL